MITTAQCQNIISASIRDFGWELRPLEETAGRVLAENLYADRDFPPFNRVAMDGICFQYEAYEKGLREFIIEGTQASGAPALQLSSPSGCLEIMTGAILPSSADTVIRYEDLDIENGMARLHPHVKLSRRKNIHVRGSDQKKGETLLEAGCILNAPQISAAATVGKTSLKVKKYPRVAIVSTGDELVPIHETPMDHQIRISNSYGIYSMLSLFGLKNIEIHHMPDVKDKLRASLKKLLEEVDVLILSGGVSMGKFDFIPEVLTDLKVNILFHKVKQKPGKPLLFGVKESEEDYCAVFGLPGNPVSSLVNSRRYIIPFLNKCLGILSEDGVSVPIEGDVILKGDLVQFVPASLIRDSDGGIKAKILKTNGSGDLVSLAHSDGFVEFIPNSEKPPRFFSWRENHAFG